MRPYARSLLDKGIVYTPNNTPGNKPIGVGHSYSVLAHLPEANEHFPWLLPLDVERVKSDEKASAVGMAQMRKLLNQQPQPFHQALCVLVSDSLYSGIENREAVSEEENLVWIHRMRSNRNVFASPEDSTAKKYGSKMTLNNPTTHQEPTEVGQFSETTRQGKKRIIHFKRWRGLLLRGSHTFKGYEHPIDLIEYQVFDSRGKPLFKRPLYLALHGNRRDEIDSRQAYQSYGKRYDLEHFFRFGKTHLLMDRFQTPELEHEENWWRIVQLAYVQLFLGREIVDQTPYPWERYLKEFRRDTQRVSPAQVQKNFYQVLDQVGTPTKDVRPTIPGKGRQLGETFPKREVSKVIIKKQKNPEKQTSQTPKSKDDDKLLRFQKKVKILKTPKLNPLVKIIKETLIEWGIKEEDLVKKLTQTAHI